MTTTLYDYSTNCKKSWNIDGLSMRAQSPPLLMDVHTYIIFLARLNYVKL